MTIEGKIAKRKRDVEVKDALNLGLFDKHVMDKLAVHRIFHKLLF